MTTDLVGPLPTIRFLDGTKTVYEVPQDTMDPRTERCTNHRPACDCREAERAEEIAELRGNLKMVEDAARTVLAGHPIWVYEDGPNGDRQVGCMCTGCQIVRASYLLPHHEGSRYARDEVDGIDGWHAEWGYRWKMCTGRCPNIGEALTRPAGKLGFISRNRGNFHDHLCTSEGEPVRKDDPEWCPW